MINLAEIIKERVKIQDVFQMYGFDVKHGAICCPFHHEKTPSLRIYNSGEKWKCFGCGEGGSVIDFIMKLFELDFKEAVSKIDIDFNLGISNMKPTLRSVLKYKRIKSKNEANRLRKEALNNQYNVLSMEFQSCREVIRLTKPKQLGEEYSDIYVEAVNRLSYLEYALDEIFKEMG